MCFLYHNFNSHYFYLNAMYCILLLLIVNVLAISLCNCYFYTVLTSNLLYHRPLTCTEYDYFNFLLSTDNKESKAYTVRPIGLLYIMATHCMKMKQKVIMYLYYLLLPRQLLLFGNYNTQS